jgi:DNA-binding transcriptional ArsR family regulator
VAETETRKGRAGRGEKVDLATALGNPWRFRIVAAAFAAPLSPSQFVRRYGGEISNVSRHFRNLAEWGYLEKVKTVTGGEHRGANMTIYRATGGAYLDMPASKDLPEMFRRGISDRILETFFERVSVSLETGTFDAEVERHLSWDVGEFDAEAFRQLSSWLDEVLARLPALRREAKRRMEESGEEPIPTTVGLFSFRSPSVPASDDVDPIADQGT